MTSIQANQISIEYDTFGDKKNPALLLIIGLAGQMINWDDAFCRRLAETGFFVIRFDNRESGLSSCTPGISLEEAEALAMSFLGGNDITMPFTIEDMADDAVGLLDALCGMSMGGFISQTICIRHPSRVLSLTSIYSHTGASSQFIPEPRILEIMLGPSSTEREAAIQEQVDFFRLVSGSGIEFDEAYHRKIVTRCFERSFQPVGTTLQYLAILAQKDRTEQLKELDIPALVIHGDEDPLVPVSGGVATAEAIKNAELKIIKGMGHALPNVDVYGIKFLRP